MPNHDTEKLDQIRKLTIISLFSASDYLMKLFVLKGGNVLNYVYKINRRSSIDIDISMEGSFEKLDIPLKEVQEILERSFVRNFEESGFKVFDICLEKKPSELEEEKEDFWGGYTLTFKVLDFDKWNEIKEAPDKDIEDMRRQAIPFTPDFHRNFRVDISRHEYCKEKTIKLLDDYSVYVYTPRMIVLEKLRAICQQTEEYENIIETHHRRARAQDFFDIYIVMQNFPDIDLTSQESLASLKEFFNIKKVPIKLLEEMENYREFHRDAFAVVEDTVFSSAQLKSYDFYFDFVLGIIDDILEAL